jgi:hypothetical protein
LSYNFCGVNLLIIFGKLDHFINVNKVGFITVKWCSLQKIYINLWEKSFIGSIPGASVVKLLAVVIYDISRVILTFCVIKIYYPGNYHGVKVNYHGNNLF